MLPMALIKQTAFYTVFQIWEIIRITYNFLQQKMYLNSQYRAYNLLLGLDSMCF